VKNVFHSYSGGKTQGNGLLMDLESFTEKRGQKSGCFPSKVSKFLMP